MSGRRHHAVAGNTDRTHQSFFSCPDRTLYRSVGAGGTIEVLEIPDGMELDQVEIVRLQAIDRAADLLICSGGGSVPGLCGEVDPVADAVHPASEVEF